jgi:parallel beta-helix repeat protein
MKFTSVLWRFMGAKQTPTSRRPAVVGLGLESLEDRWVPSTLTVGAGQQYSTIGAAITAAHAGDTVKVYQGTYQEQVTIGEKLTLVAADPGTDREIIKAPSTLNGSIVEINNNAAGVVVKGFKIDGGGNANGTIVDGVHVSAGASATIRQNHVTNLYNGTNNQFGNGIEIDGKAAVLYNTVDSYQKDGILVDTSSASANVSNNTVTGEGSVNLVAQNGIQVSNGAQANVTWNTVTQNSYSNTASDGFTATGILVYNDTASVVLGQNDVTSNELGGYLAGASSTSLTENVVVTNNGFSGNGSIGGLLLNNTSTITVTHNCADGNGSDGIYVLNSTSVNVLWNEAKNNTNNGSMAVQGTHIQGNGNGIVIDGGSGNTIEFDLSLVNASNGILLVNTSGNTISYSVSAANVGDGILLLNAKNNTIHCNLVVANDGSGIYLDSASTGNTIDNNIVADNGDGSYSAQLGVNGNNNTWQNAIITFGTFGCYGLDDGSSC